MKMNAPILNRLAGEGEGVRAMGVRVCVVLYYAVLYCTFPLRGVVLCSGIVEQGTLSPTDSCSI